MRRAFLLLGTLALAVTEYEGDDDEGAGIDAVFTEVAPACPEMFGG